MVTRVSTVAFAGIEARAVDVQIQITPGNVAFTVVGLPDKAVAESRERVRSALIAAGLALPAKRIIVNLAPADLPKEGSHYDLPIALGIMAAIGAVPTDALNGFTVLGELALDGAILPVAGVLPAAIAANGRGTWPHLSRRLRRRGRLGGRRHGYPVATVPDPARQPFQGHPGHGPPGTGDHAGPQEPAGPARHQGTGERQADPGDRGSRRPQSVHERAAGSRQVHAGAAPSLDPAASRPPRASRSVDDPVRGRTDRRRRPVRPPTVPGAPSFRLHGGPGGRRQQCPPGRGVPRPPRHPVSRRVAGVPAPGSRQPAPAPGGRRDPHRAGEPSGELPCPLPARGRHESLPLRPCHGGRLRLPPPAERPLHRPVPGPDLRAPHGSHRSRRSTCRPSPPPT